MASISIIIPHYNNYQILNDCLESLYESELHGAEIIIVNNNSTDDSIKKIITKFSNPIIISTPTNLGYAGGCNYGAKHAKGELLVFLNNDTEVDKEWLSQLIKTMGNQAHIASVQPKILNKNNQKTFDYAGASGGFIDKYCYPFARGRIFNTIENDDGQYDDIKLSLIHI